MHPDQLTVTLEGVRSSVAEQFPQWKDLDISQVPLGGTVNALFRIGPGLAARFPLEPDEPAEVRRRLQSEAEAAGSLVGRTRFATPEPIAIGEPTKEYPLPWSIQTWIPGDVATGKDSGDSDALAGDVAEFIAGVRQIDTGGTRFDGEGRGGDLSSHDEWVRSCFDKSEALLDVSRLRSIWTELVELPSAGADVMAHSDLIPGNILVGDGRLVGVIDVGGLGPADPSLDLVSAWHLFDASARETVRKALRCSDLEWQRGKAWAFEQAIGLVWYYAKSNPTMSEMGRRTLDRIAAERN